MPDFKNLDFGFGDLWLALFLSVCVVTCGWSPNCQFRCHPPNSGFDFGNPDADYRVGKRGETTGTQE